MSAFFYIVFLYTSCLAMNMFYRDLPLKRWKFPWVTLSLTILVAFMFVMQQHYSDLLPEFERNPAIFLSGQIWTIVTALFVQDGGTSGAIFNCVCLLIIGSIAEQYWKRSELFILFLIGGVLSELFAFLWQPIGGGNSIANFAIAGSLIYVSFNQGSTQIRRICLIGIGALLFLLSLNDIHGSAGAIGIFLGYVFQQSKKLVKN